MTEERFHTLSFYCVHSSNNTLFMTRLASKVTLVDLGSYVGGQAPRQLM